jgi:hypothetical protein
VINTSVIHRLNQKGRVDGENGGMVDIQNGLEDRVIEGGE